MKERGRELYLLCSLWEHIQEPSMGPYWWTDRPQMTFSTLGYLWSSSDPDVLQNRRQWHWGRRWMLGCRNDIRGSLSFLLMSSLQIALYQFFTLPPWRSKGNLFKRDYTFCVRKEGVAVQGWANSGFHRSPPTSFIIGSSMFCPVRITKNS